MKWHRHCARQQKKRLASGDVQTLVDVNNDDTRHVVLEPPCNLKQVTRQVIIESAERGEADQPGTSSLAENDIKETPHEVEGDDVLSIHAESDDEL